MSVHAGSRGNGQFVAHSLEDWVEPSCVSGCFSNHEEESEFIYGDDTTKLTACNYNSNDCAKSYRWVPEVFRVSVLCIHGNLFPGHRTNAGCHC
jgi:hypothetical protein